MANNNDDPEERFRSKSFTQVELPLAKKVEMLEQALERLMNENAAYREAQERSQILIRKRSPKLEGLSHLEVIRHILDDRDQAEDATKVHREVMKRAKAAVGSGNVKEAYDILNLFLLAK